MHFVKTEDRGQHMAYENTNFKSIVDVDITVCVFSEKNTKKRSRSELFTMCSS